MEFWTAFFVVSAFWHFAEIVYDYVLYSPTSGVPVIAILIRFCIAFTLLGFALICLKEEIAFAKQRLDWLTDIEETPHG